MVVCEAFFFMVSSFTVRVVMMVVSIASDSHVTVVHGPVPFSRSVVTR